MTRPVSTHAKHRADDRAGVNLLDSEWEDLVRQIRHGLARRLPHTPGSPHGTAHQHGRLEGWIVAHGEKQLAVGYCRECGTIVTVYPEDYAVKIGTNLGRLLAGVK